MQICKCANEENLLMSYYAKDCLPSIKTLDDNRRTQALTKPISPEKFFNRHFFLSFQLQLFYIDISI